MSDEFKESLEIFKRSKRLLFASFMRALWLSLITPAPKNNAVVKNLDIERVTEPGEPAEHGNSQFQEEIAKGVKDALAEQSKSDDTSGRDLNDFELQRIVSLFKLCRQSGYTLRLEPGTPEENAPIFDFDAGQIIHPAA